MKTRKEKTALRKAVDWLKDQRKINRDNDLAEIFNLDKSTISTYLNGKPGIDFMNEFEKYFKISLKDFEDGEAILPKKIDKSDEIAVLKVQVKELTRALAQLNETVTKKPALDFYLELEKRMKSELIEQSGLHRPS